MPTLQEITTAREEAVQARIQARKIEQERLIRKYVLQYKGGDESHVTLVMSLRDGIQVCQVCHLTLHRYPWIRS